MEAGQATPLVAVVQGVMAVHRADQLMAEVALRMVAAADREAPAAIQQVVGLMVPEERAAMAELAAMLTIQLTAVRRMRRVEVAVAAALAEVRKEVALQGMEEVVQQAVAQMQIHKQTLVLMPAPELQAVQVEMAVPVVMVPVPMLQVEQEEADRLAAMQMLMRTQTAAATRGLMQPAAMAGVAGQVATVDRREPPCRMASRPQ